MDEEYMKHTVENDIIPEIDSFLDEETGFLIYVEYSDRKTGVKSLIAPAPPIEALEEVMQRVAREIHNKIDRLPALIIACERVQYREEDNVGQLDSGLIIVAVDGPTANGIIFLYSLPDKELLMTKSFDKDSDEAPPYSMLGVSSFMHETLVQMGAVQKGEEKNDARVTFKFSRN